MAIPTQSILGLPVASTNYREAFEQASDWAKGNEQPRLVEAANTHVLALARHHLWFRRVMERFDLILPDGMPLVWVLNFRFKAKLKDRVYGPTLMARSFEWSQELPHSHIKHFLLGSSPEIIEKLETNLRKRYPKAAIVGAYSPPFSKNFDDGEKKRIIDCLRDSQANFVWTCFGCPKQEAILAELKPELPSAVYYGIGAAFAFHAGHVKQAPSWIQKLGLEWLFRMMKEPRRLFRRYLTYNSLFLYYLFQRN